MRQSVTELIRSVKPSQATKESDNRHRQYCTQACLLGLIQKHPLDDACLNVNAYCAYKVGNYYALRQKSLAKLILR